MKNILAVLCLLFIISCTSKKEKTVSKGEIELTITDDDRKLKATDRKNFDMIFDIETIQYLTNEIKKQQFDMKHTTYDSEVYKKRAMGAINALSEMLEGEFCCTTHNGQHCKTSEQLEKLANTYNCARFKKKS